MESGSFRATSTVPTINALSQLKLSWLYYGQFATSLMAPIVKISTKLSGAVIEFVDAVSLGYHAANMLKF